MKILFVDDAKLDISARLTVCAMSKALRLNVFNKLNSYIEHGDIYSCKNLKVLKPKIWKYKGTIYKLRVDAGKESIRVLFAKSREGNLVILHAFLKSTRKTPAKDAHHAIAVYAMQDKLDKTPWEIEESGRRNIPTHLWG